MTIVFATCDHQPLLTADDQVLADALLARGVAVEPVPWTEIDPYGFPDRAPIVLRSMWDYHRVPTLFAAWLDALVDSGRSVFNDARVARSNIDKIYLQDLERVGIAIPKTRWLDVADMANVSKARDQEAWPRAVLKPRIAATAYGTFVIDDSAELSDDDLAPARSSGALLQEFVAEIEHRGETSLVYCDGIFSHAVVKRAKDGEFRVQKDFGGRVERVNPSAAMLAFADRVLATLPAPQVYARVDVVDSARGPLLMELELIEPELYFLIAPAAAATFADSISRRLHIRS